MPAIDRTTPAATQTVPPYRYHSPGLVTGAPVLDDALAVLECRTTAVHDAGDHSIVVGQVQAAAGPSDPGERGPLVHYSGAYRRLG